MQRIISAVRDFFRKGDLLLLMLCVGATIFGIVVISSATNYYGNTRYVLIQSFALLLGVMFYFLFTLIDVDIFAERRDLLFIFNWNGQKSFSDYGILVPEGKYQVVLNTDAKEFAGFGLADDSVEHFTVHDDLYAKDGKGWLKMYLPARSAVVLKRS